MVKWQVNALGQNKAEVVTPRVRYVIKADATSFTLEAFKRETLIEKVWIKHVRNKYWLEGTDSAGRTERRTMQFTGKRVVSSGVIGGKRFTVDSSVCSHIPLLVTKLRGTKQIRLPLISAFSKRFKDDGRLRGQVQARVDTAMLMRSPDSVVLACVIICAECFFTGGLLACTLCDLCLRPDPPT